MSALVQALWRPAAGLDLEVTRAFRRSVEVVWPALVEPARLCQWMGVEWLGDETPLSEGARFDYRFANTDLESRGHVLRLEPKRLFQHSWFENIPPTTIVTWRLDPTPEGCRLTLTQQNGALDDAPRTATGWTMLLESLAASLGEGEAPSGDRVAWHATRDRYARDFPPQASRDGRRVEVDGVKGLRFVRWLPSPPDKVWATLTKPESLTVWLRARAQIEPRVGGRFHLVLGEGASIVPGEVIDWDPPRRLEITWPEPGTTGTGGSTLAFDLEPTPQGTKLTLTHLLPGGGDDVGFASGWHWHLDALGSALEGAAPALDERRWRALNGIYAATL
jgi:uncharacterized protein YndB with AHSA1/START domain